MVYEISPKRHSATEPDMSPSRMRVPRVFGRSLHQRVITVAWSVSLVAITGVTVMIDARHSDVVMSKVARDTESLMSEFAQLGGITNVVTSGPAVYDKDRPLIVRGVAVIAPELENLFSQEGRAAAITLNDKLLWQSDQDLERLPSMGPSMQGHWKGIETISVAGRPYEAYLISQTVQRKIHKPGAPGGGNPQLETFPVTYHVALAMDPYRREIRTLRRDLATVVVLAMIVLSVAMSFMIRRQLRPLERITQNVSEMKGLINERVEQRDSDPHEIRALADRFNQFLRKQDEIRASEEETRKSEEKMLKELRIRITTMEETIRNKTIDYGGFMHSLGHLLGSIQLTEFKTIPKAEQNAVRENLHSVQGMIRDKLHDLVRTETVESAPSNDVVSMANRLFIHNKYTGKSPLLSFMRGRHPDKDFADDFFELNHEEKHLHVRIVKTLLQELMINLLHNAGKEADKRVRMTLARKDEMAQIIVEDDGTGFPPAGRRNLMIWGKTTGGKRKGHGIGLPYVRRVASRATITEICSSGIATTSAVRVWSWSYHLMMPQ